MASRYHRPALSIAYPQEKPSRRSAIKYTLAGAFFIGFFIIFTASPVPTAKAKDAAQHINPFKPIAHQPPRHRNSTSGEAKWYDNYKWLKPFSETITQDENRSVLPPTKTRPPIYAFYDTGAEKDEATKAAENKLLLIWRRAWWAQGFRPIILGRAEAMSNPLYELFQGRKMEHTLEVEFVRWLAWGRMGTGILANWLVLPMGTYDDYLLSYLRRGEYPNLTRYEGLHGGLYSGDKSSIDAALAEALNSPKLLTSKTFIEAVDPKTFSLDPKPSAIAFYESTAIAEHYKSVSSTLVDDKPAGLVSLAQLITSHLHVTFLDIFSAGLVILTPYPANFFVVTEHATKLATSLTYCPPSPLPSSCPPNNPTCTPCSSATPLSIKISESFLNTSNLFTIGTVPHPYTLATLLAPNKIITVRHIRRETKRDPWLQVITQETLGKDMGGQSRIVNFKETVASDWGAARGLWFTEETTLSRRDLEWNFGFEIPAYNTTTSTTIPLSIHTEGGMKHPSGKDFEQQKMLLAEAKEVLRRGEKKGEGIRDAVEAWNLADTEAWRFVRAFGARGRLERKRWEEEERKFAGGEEGKGKGWGRYFDR